MLKANGTLTVILRSKDAEIGGKDQLHFLLAVLFLLHVVWFTYIKQKGIAVKHNSK